MNTNGLARHYSKLTARERVPLILAASARGDTVEREHLMHSAPTNLFKVPDYHGLSQGLLLGSTQHLAKLLHLATLYWALSYKLARTATPEAERASRTVKVAGYLFLANLAGWRAVCAELHIDPEQFWRHEPSFETLAITEQATQLDAFTAEEAAGYLQELHERRGEEQGPLWTAEAVADSLRRLLDQQLAEWS